MLRRNLLYTGVTRGRQLVVIVGDRRAIGIAVRGGHSLRRWSKLEELARSRPTDQAEATVSFAIIRGNNGRRHGVDAEVEVDVAVGSETVEIAVDAKHDQTPSDKRRFATIL
jgi:hypothetical protein